MEPMEFCEVEEPQSACAQIWRKIDKNFEMAIAEIAAMRKELEEEIKNDKRNTRDLHTGEIGVDREQEMSEMTNGVPREASKEEGEREQGQERPVEITERDTNELEFKEMEASEIEKEIIEKRVARKTAWTWIKKAMTAKKHGEQEDAGNFTQVRKMGNIENKNGKEKGEREKKQGGMKLKLKKEKEGHKRVGRAFWKEREGARGVPDLMRWKRRDEG